MALLQWLPEYELGHPEIDSQHRRWFLLTDVFLEKAYTGTATTSVIEKALADVVGYARYHFNAEEDFMRNIGYNPGHLQAHVDMHDAFVERVNDLAQRSKVGDPETVQEMINFLTEWLRQHILETDVKYIAYHRKMQAKPKARSAAPRMSKSRVRARRRRRLS